MDLQPVADGCQRGSFDSVPDRPPGRGRDSALQFGIGSFLPARTLSQGLQYSIACAEQRGFSAAAIDTSGPYQAFARAVARLSFGPERLLAACRIWDVPNLDPSANAVVGDTPTLLLAGEFDPATPPSYAQSVARTLTAARVFTLPGVAHTPIDGGPCPMSLALAFMDDPTRVPDGACVSRMKVRFVVEPIAERLLWPSVPSVAMLAICLSVMVSVPVGWAIVVWRDRRSPSEAPLRARRAKWCAVAAVGLNLAFAVIVLAANPMEIVYGYPIALRAAMILPLLSLLPISGAVSYVLLALRGANRSRCTAAVGPPAHAGVARLALAAELLVSAAMVALASPEPLPSLLRIRDAANQNGPWPRGLRI